MSTGQIDHASRIPDYLGGTAHAQLLRAALVAAANGVVITDRDGRIQWVNPAFTEMTGYALEDVVGRNPSLLKSGKQDEAYYRALWQTVLAGQVWQGVLVNRRKDGSLYSEEQTITPVRADGGEITHFIAIKQDITHRRTAERQARTRARQQELVAMLSQQALAGASFEVLVEAAIVQVTAALGAECCELLDYRSDPPRLVWRAGSGWDTTPDEDLALETAVDEVESHAFDSGSPVILGPGAEQFERSRLLRAYGIRSGICVPIAGENRPLGVFGVYLRRARSFTAADVQFLQTVADVLAHAAQRGGMEAHRQRLERQLRQSQKMEAIGLLASGVAHDFNNILTCVMGYAELAQDRYRGELDARLVDYLGEILKAGERARQVVAQLLAFARGAEAEAVVLDVAPLVREVTRLLRSVIPASVGVQVEIEEALPPVLIDPAHLQRILMNLCINARDAMQGRGVLLIGVEHRPLAPLRVCASCQRSFAGGFVEVFVRDTGRGIAAKDVDKIFEPFFTTKPPGQGSGMGLSVVHGVVHQHGGHILVESEPGRGTEFRVCFPMSERRAAAVSPPPVQVGAAPTGTGAQLLVVDDDPAIANLVAELLRGHGYRVDAYTSSRAALDAFAAESGRFDLVITEQLLAEVTGIEMLQEMRRSRPDLPAILCSSQTSDAPADAARTRLLAKPLRAEDLLGCVQAALAPLPPRDTGGN